MTDDRAAKKADEILPCCNAINDRDFVISPHYHCPDDWRQCYACRRRSAIASELRKAYRLADLESEAKESSWNHINLLEAEIARLRDELAKMKP